MTTTTTSSGSLCQKCARFGVIVVGRTPSGKNTFKNVKMCRYCGTRYEE